MNCWTNGWQAIDSVYKTLARTIMKTRPTVNDTSRTRWWRLLAMTAMGLLLAGGITGNTKGSDASDDAKVVAPAVSESTYLVVKIDPSRPAAPTANGVSTVGATDSASEAQRQWAADVERRLEWLRTTTAGNPFYLAVNMPSPQSRWPAIAIVKATLGLEGQQLVEQWELLDALQVVARDGYLVAAPEEGLNVNKLLDNAPATPRDEVREALEASVGYPVQVAFVPPAHVRRTMRELMPQLPAAWGGGASEVLSEGLVWAALGVDPVALRGELVIQSASEPAARAFAEALPGLLRQLLSALPNWNSPAKPEVAANLLSELKPIVEGTRIRTRFDVPGKNAEVVDYLASTLLSTTTALERRGLRQRLLEVLVAMHNHHDVYRVFPPRAEVRDAQGRSKLSWRVHLLPFLGQQELYNQFHLDEEWDSPHNKTLLEKMPNVYKQGVFGADPAHPLPPGYTTIVAPVGAGTIFGGDKPVRFRDMRDGTSNTIALVEVKPELAVPWTSPQDYAFDPQAPVSGLRCWPDGKFLVVFGDGSVREVSSRLKLEYYNAMFTINGGEMYSLDEEE